MLTAGEGNTDFSVTRPTVRMVFVDYRTGRDVVGGHLRVVPFKDLAAQVDSRPRENEGVSGGNNAVVLGTDKELLRPTLDL